MLAGGLVLHSLREQRDEITGAKIRAIHSLLFEMTLEIRQKKCYESIEAVKVLLKHRQYRIEQRTQLKQVYDLSHHCECESFISQEQVQESRNKVHSLTVVQIRIHHSVSEENFTQIFIVNALRGPE